MNLILEFKKIDRKRREMEEMGDNFNRWFGWEKEGEDSSKISSSLRKRVVAEFIELEGARPRNYASKLLLINRR